MWLASKSRECGMRTVACPVGSDLSSGGKSRECGMRTVACAAGKKIKGGWNEDVGMRAGQKTKEWAVNLGVVYGY